LGVKRKAETGGQDKLINDVFNVICFSSNIIKVIKLRRIGQARKREKKYA
jgi:hypothetical protein